jgi:hypothetical protein
LSQLNNHFGLYLYGKQIVDGLKPFWDGADPYMTGNIAVWTAARQQAVNAKYERMYNFDDAQAGNVRLIAMDIHPTMSNR